MSITLAEGAPARAFAFDRSDRADAALRRRIAALPFAPTVFIVSQRTASIRDADLVLVLENGEIIGKGTHEELLETCPVYREIHTAQFGNGEEVGV